MKRFTISVIAALLCAQAVPALAGPFFDVPDDHPYVQAITELKERGIMTGDKNADGSPKGTARPDEGLSRVELLALAYRAAGKEIRSVFNPCFPDAKGWFEGLVCTAKHNGDIQGNPDGLFHPADPVNNVGMLKIVLNSLGFAIPTLTLESQVGLDFKNVNIRSWYAPYLLAAVLHNLLPADLTKDNDFHPDAAPTRGVAAEIIHRALAIPSEERGKTADAARKRTDAPPSGATLVDFPFDRKGRTAERGASAFVFDLESATTVLVQSANETSPGIGLECYLYLLNTSNLPDEIFVGYREGGQCFLRAALQPGRYQLEVRARQAGEIFSVKAEQSSGDGNDGYGDAIVLERDKPLPGILTGDGPDYTDWFRFTIATQTTRVVHVSSDAAVVCSVIPGPSVDLSSFESPRCEEAFSYDPGIYYVSVQRAPPATAKEEYTVELR